MPRLESESIILRSFPLAEQDKLVVFFGRDRGIFKGVAKGARKFGNRFGSSLEPMSHVRVFSYEKEGRELVTVSGCDLLESFFELQTRVEVSFTLGYFAELIEDARPSVTHDDILFRLLRQVLQALKAGGDLKFLTAYFEVWFLKLNGFLPDLTRCLSCRSDIAGASRLAHNKDGALCRNCAPGEHQDEIPPKMGDFLGWVRKNPPAGALPFPLSQDEIAGVRRVLKHLIVYHMERSPKSLSFLDQSH